MTKDSFIFYRSFYEAVKELSADEQIKVYQAICEYSLNGELPDLTGIPKAIFTLIKPQIEANNKRYENGKKGGRPKTETEEKPKDNQTETKPEPNVNDNVNVNDLTTTTEEKKDFEIYGKEYENVYLSKVQYQKLSTEIMDTKTLNILIEEFSQKLAEGKEPNFDGKENHFARLKAYWNHRKKHPEKFIEGFKKTAKNNNLAVVPPKGSKYGGRQ